MLYSGDTKCRIIFTSTNLGTPKYYPKQELIIVDPVLIIASSAFSNVDRTFWHLGPTEWCGTPLGTQNNFACVNMIFLCFLLHYFDRLRGDAAEETQGEGWTQRPFANRSEQTTGEHHERDFSAEVTCRGCREETI